MPLSRREAGARVLSLDTLGRVLFPRRTRARHAAKVRAPSPPPPGRAVDVVYTSCRQICPDGLSVRRASSTLTPELFSPFLLLDHVGPQRLPTTKGCDLPRTGLSMLSYVLQGRLQYQDSTGSDELLAPGCAHLVTAGSGIVLSHTGHGDEVLEHISIWLNLPRELKSAVPSQAVDTCVAATIIGTGRAAAKIALLLGPGPKSGDRDAPAPELQTVGVDAAVYDVRMRPDARVKLHPTTRRCFVYVYRGAADIAGTRVKEGCMAALKEGAGCVALECARGKDSNNQSVASVTEAQENFAAFEKGGCWCIILSGEPLDEPVSWLTSGFVACTPHDVRKAFEEYTHGSLGATSPCKLPASLSGAVPAVSSSLSSSSTDLSTIEDGKEAGADADADETDFLFGELDV